MNRHQKHPAIREIGVLQKDGKLVAVVVPAHAGGENGEGGGKKGEAAIRKALDEEGRRTDISGLDLEAALLLQKAAVGQRPSRWIEPGMFRCRS